MQDIGPDGGITECICVGSVGKELGGALGIEEEAVRLVRESLHNRTAPLLTSRTKAIQSVLVCLANESFPARLKSALNESIHNRYMRITLCREKARGSSPPSAFRVSRAQFILPPITRHAKARMIHARRTRRESCRLPQCTFATARDAHHDSDMPLTEHPSACVFRL